MTLLEPQGTPASEPSAHVDTFVRDNLPPVADWPPLDFSGVPDLRYPARINCAVELLDRMAQAGHADRPAIHFEGRVLIYRELLENANRIAHVLVEELGVVPGNRVLLRGPNNPTMVASWFAVLKMGGVVVTTMPLLRARELSYILEKARVSVALCDSRLLEDMRVAMERAAGPGGAHRVRVAYFGPEAPAAGGEAVRHTLEALAADKPSAFENVATAADDPALIAFTSGTTGQAKGTVHFHRDVLAVCDTFSRYILRPTAEDIFTGTPPLAFTYGLGGLLLFPLRVGASSALVEKTTPDGLLQALQDYGATTLFTSPTMYRTLVDLVSKHDVSSLKKCVSAGEPLPLPTYEAWLRATGIKIIDGIGSTEMLHIFISAAGDDIRPGSTGKVVPGYQACVVDDSVNPVPPGTVGKLAVRGPTGCRYLADPERQRAYVQNGWNLTGDAYKMDEDGYFWFQARADDMIISAGYNIAGPEVENVLLEHPKVKECAVVAAPDPIRGNIVKAFIVLREPADATATTVEELQRFVKSEIAPYKYPRAIEFVDSLPRTETGKLQRYKLRQMEQERAQSARAGG